MTDLAAIRPKLEDLLRTCGTIALEVRANHDRRVKPDGSLVTKADQQIEDFLHAELPKLVPGTRVWGEEHGHQSPGESGLWLVDPVDGTTNYSFGSPLWGTSIGLLQQGTITLGGMILPELREIYSAHSQGGATLNGKALPPVRPGDIDRTELVSYAEDTLLAYPTADIPGKMRYNGAFVVEAAFMAKGAFRGLISQRANLYDIAASVVILQELGAEFRQVTGEAIDLEWVAQHGRMPGPFVIFPAGNTFRV
ncbi:MAG: hypothetical protein JNJ45_04565 [Chthonomonas sp.]|nr:hypothetical protein [Chthonomonas sp.]